MCFTVTLILSIQIWIYRRTGLVLQSQRGSMFGERTACILFKALDFHCLVHRQKESKREEREEAMRLHPPAARNFLQTTSKPSTHPPSETHSGSNTAHANVVHCQCEISCSSALWRTACLTAKPPFQNSNYHENGWEPTMIKHTQTHTHTREGDHSGRQQNMEPDCGCVK